jgi:uncharacterized protein YecE (DUF72 family)
MNLYVGTSGYSYEEWKGKFYPEDMPEKEMLRFYGERFNAVEINNTFYRMPNPKVLEGWANEVPEHFRFIIKASQKITHFQRLKNEDDSLPYLLKVTSVLGERLGPLLFQTPSHLKKDIPRLASFLKALPGERRAAFEFRSASWFDQELFDLLREHNAALCIAEAEEGVEVPFQPTADWGYLRLRRPDYDDAALQSWIDRIAQTGWRDTFIFFKHEDEGKGPEMAARYLKLTAGQTSNASAARG